MPQMLTENNNKQALNYKLLKWMLSEKTAE